MADFINQDPVEILSDSMRVLTFRCRGAAPANTDSNAENTKLIKGWRLIKIIADPGSTAPDAADVLILDDGAEDLLEGLGTNLIHATNRQSLYPIDAGDTSVIGIPIISAITLDINNQATANALYDIILVFAK